MTPSISNHIKTIGLVVCGNVLDYYDFLLFAHLGGVITTFFVPTMTTKDAHILGLLLFALPFIIRPIGGYVFGHISDSIGRSWALGETLRYACLASFAIAILPSYAYGGMLSAWAFFCLRAMQGMSLGGEYTTAGTFLMELYPTRQGLLSSILCASGTIGSLFAFAFAWLYLHEFISGEGWRIGFAIGGIGTFISYILRKHINSSLEKSGMHRRTYPTFVPYFSTIQSVTITLLIGMLVGVTCWIPMVYSNFYLTKILNFPLDQGLKATFIALTLYVVFNPLVGMASDRYSSRCVMVSGALLTVPLCGFGYYLLTQGYLLGQFFLILGAAIFGAPIHVVMNQLFPPSTRSRYINTSFMIGSSFGGLTPFIAGYFVDHYGFHNAPIVIVMTLGLITFGVLYHFFYKVKTNV